MALKKRFQKKEIEIKSVDEKEKFKEVPVMKLVSNEFDNTAIVNEISQLPSSEKSDYAVKQIYCYHKINELIQQEGLGLYNLMSGILNIASLAIGAEGGSLWIRDEDILECKVANGPMAKNIEGLKVKMGEGIVGWTAKSLKSTIVYDTKKDDRFLNQKANDPTKTLIASPLVYNGENIGVIEFVNRADDSFYTDSDKNFLDGLAVYVAMHIKTTRTLKEQKYTLDRLETIKTIQEKISSTVELEKLLPLVMEKALNLLNAEVGSLWLVEPHGEGIECAYAVDPTKNQVEGLKMKKGQGIIGAVVEENESLIVEDCSKDNRFSSAMDSKIKFKTKTMVAVSLAVKGEVIGAMQIINKKNGQFFNGDDLDLLELFGRSCSMSIKIARLFDSEKKAKDLSALIEISKEVTSTLDIDSVLFSVVNLSGQVIPFDISYISSSDKVDEKKMNLSAISGQKEIDDNDNQAKETEKIHNYLAKHEIEELSITSLEDYQKSEHKIEMIADYMSEYEIETLYLKLLSDDQGSVGVFSCESESTSQFGPSHYEILNILCSQATVALRNADLYNTIPKGKLIQSLRESFILGIRKFHTLPRKTMAKWAVTLTSLMAFIFMVKLPHSVSTNIEILPKSDIYYSLSNGTIAEILVKEGDIVKKGDVLLKMDTTELAIEKQKKEFQLQKLRTEMFDLKSQRDTANYKIKESEYLSTESELKLTLEKLKAAIVVAQSDGVIISEGLDDMIGMPVNFGQELIKLASHNQLVVQFQIPEENVKIINPGQEIKFKVYGHPTQSFGEGVKLYSVSGEGRQILETDPTKYFLAAAKIDSKNDSNQKMLRPGMTGRGKIVTDSKTLAYKYFAKVYHYILMDFLF